MLVRSVVPLLSAYILLMSLLLSGNWILQGLVEERSNKLIETVLACISPDELLYGKLAGTVAVGLDRTREEAGGTVNAAASGQPRTPHDATARRKASGIDAVAASGSTRCHRSAQRTARNQAPTASRAMPPTIGGSTIGNVVTTRTALRSGPAP